MLSDPCCSAVGSPQPKENRSSVSIVSRLLAVGFECCLILVVECCGQSSAKGESVQRVHCQPFVGHRV